MALDDAIQILTTIKNALTTAITTADVSSQSGEFANAFELLRTAKYYQVNFKGLSLQKNDHPDVDLHLNTLILQVAHLIDQGKVPTSNLITVLEQTYALLTGSLDHNAYQEIAKTMEKDQEPGMAIMGGIMIALRLVLAAALATS